MSFMAYTDYPLYKEEYGKKAPIREVEVLEYDANKLVRIQYNDEEFTIKAGYLYKNEKRITDSDVKTVSRDMLESISCQNTNLDFYRKN